jgi:hypothetical protein
MNMNWIYQSTQAFFGPAPNKGAIYEELFVLMYHMKQDFNTVYGWPIQLRKYFVNRLIEQLTAENDAVNNVK